MLHCYDRLGWLLVLGLYEEDYLQIFKRVCPFDYRAWDPINIFIQTSFATPTDRPKSDRNRYVI